MKEISNHKWSDFVANHPHGNIFQTPEFYNIYLNTKNYEPLFVSVEENNNLTAILLAVIQKQHSGLLGKFSARSIIIGGPLVVNNNHTHLEQILKKYNLTIKGKAIYTQFRNLWDWSEHKDVFEKTNFHYIPHLDIIIDTNDLKSLEQGISQNKKRNIVKSRNKGVEFKEITGKNEFMDCLNLVYSTYKRIGLPCTPKDHLISAYKELFPINRLKIFGAYFNGFLIGVRLELIYKDQIYDWYAGANENESNKYPNDFLIYNILLWSHSKGLKTFDFGGAGKPNQPYGVRDHKLKFSNNLVEFGRFECVHNKLLFKIGNLALKLYKTINDIYR